MTNPWGCLKCQGEGGCDLGLHYWSFAQIMEPGSQVPRSLLKKLSLVKVKECLWLRKMVAGVIKTNMNDLGCLCQSTLLTDFSHSCQVKTYIFIIP